MPTPYRFEVPENPPNEGDFLIVGFNPDWLPIIIAMLQPLRAKVFWNDPPDDIAAQVDELMYLLGHDLDP